MKKTLIASAVAAATFSGAVMAQEGTNNSAAELAAMMDSMPQVYGNIQLAYAYTDIENGGNEQALFDNGSTLGVKHSHEIMPGLEGFLKIELDGVDADDKSKGRGRIRLDEAYIGVKGDNFGQVWVGSDDSTYESAIDEIANYYEVASQSIGGSYDTGEGDLIQYKTPSFGGLTLAGAVQINGNGEKGENSYPYQLAAKYDMAGLELAVAMDSNDGDRAYNNNTNASSVNNENTYGVRASYNLDNLRVTGQYQTRKDVADVYGIFGAYSMGSNTFAASWELGSPENGEDFDVITLQALHNLSDNMYVYVEGYVGSGDDYQGVDQDERTDIAFGGTYYF
ncbi:porin [Marinobacter sp. 1Y8]